MGEPVRHSAVPDPEPVAMWNGPAVPTTAPEQISGRILNALLAAFRGAPIGFHLDPARRYWIDEYGIYPLED